MRRIGASLLAGLGLATAVEAYEESGVVDGGTLRGFVTFSGAPPSLEPLRVIRNRDVCGDQKASEALVLGEGQGVRGGVVMIQGIKRGKKPGAEVVMDNRGCLFVPHVVGVMVGGPMSFRNSDAMLHNMHGHISGRTVFNLGLPMKDHSVDIERWLSTPGVVRVRCDAHPHMFAWIVVHDSPYVTVTDDRGAFAIEQVPPGTYTVTLWHEGFRQVGAKRGGRPIYDEPRTVTKEVTIPARGSVTIDFELK